MAGGSEIEETAVSEAPHSSARPWNFWLALGLWVTTVAIAIADLVLVGLTVTQFPNSIDANDFNKGLPLRIELPLFGLGFASVGALISSRLPSNTIGWIFAGLGLQAALQALGVEYGERGAHIPGGLPMAAAAETIASTTGRYFFIAAFAFILLLYPTGRFLGRAWQGIGALTALTFVINLMEQVVSLPGPIWVVSILSAVLPLTAVVSVLFRYRRGGREERQQIKLLLYASVVVLIFAVLGPHMSPSVS